MKPFCIPALVFLLGLILDSCSKNESAPRVFSFRIDSLRDLPVRRVTSASVPLSVITTGGEPETVSLRFDTAGFPRGVLAEISPDSATPDFSARVSFFIGLNSETGTHPLTIIGTGRSGAIVTKRFNLHIRSENCAHDFTAGNWEGVRVCSGSPQQGFRSTTEHISTAGEISISNFAGLGVTVAAHLDCEKGTIIIPQRTYNNAFTVGGSGTFSESIMRIRMTYSDTTMKRDTCSLTYDR